MISKQLQEAQAKLAAKRAASGIDDNIDARQHLPAATTPAGASWNLANASQDLARLRGDTPPPSPSMPHLVDCGGEPATIAAGSPGVASSHIWGVPKTEPTGGRGCAAAAAGIEGGAPIYGNTVRHYPTIGQAALAAGESALYRVWLAGRWLDHAGRGWLWIEDVRAELTTGGRLALCGWRRMRQLLAAGDGRLWHYDRRRRRLWLLGASRLARLWGVDRLRGRAVAINTSHIQQLGQFNAELYASLHSGRRQAAPISRAIQRELYSIPERTQRHYCRRAGIIRRFNFAIGARMDASSSQDAAWQRGRAWFVYLDAAGDMGAPGAKYNAWSLPATHEGPHQQLPKGRQRKINRDLDLVNLGTQGNGATVDRMYFPDGGAAAKAFNRNASVDRYWLSDRDKHRFVRRWNVLES